MDNQTLQPANPPAQAPPAQPLSTQPEVNSLKNLSLHKRFVIFVVIIFLLILSYFVFIIVQGFFWSNIENPRMPQEMPQEL